MATFRKFDSNASLEFIQQHTIDPTIAIATFRDNVARGFPATAFVASGVFESNENIKAIAVSPDGIHLTAGCTDGRVIIWNYKTRTFEKELQGHTDAINSLCFSPDGQWLLTGSCDHTARIWNVQEGSEVHKLINNDPVNSVAWSPDGNLVATGKAAGRINGSAMIWTVHNGKVSHTLFHHRPVNAVQFSFDGTKLLTHAGRIAYVWEAHIPKRKALRTLKFHQSNICAMAVSPTEPLVLTGGRDNGVALWDINKGKRLPLGERFGAAVACVAFSPDGSRMLAAAPASAALNSIPSGSMVIRPPHTPLVEEDASRLHVQSTDANAAAFSHNGHLFATGCLSGEVKLWRLHPFDLIVNLQVHEEPVISVMFSPDDSEFITLSKDGTGRIWSVLEIERIAKEVASADVEDSMITD